MSASGAQLDLSMRVGDALGDDVVRAQRVGGGDVAEAYRMVTRSERVVFAKTHPSPPPDFFETEASGLSWLREANSTPVPEVLAVGPGLLVLEWIEEGRSDVSTDWNFGQSLAMLHRSGAECFGRTDRKTTGSRALPNEPCETWAEFYSTNRLLPLARLASDTHALSTVAVARLESVAGRLDDFGAARERPARLHGDLWSGNRLVDTHGSSWLIDPAAHGGHREFDLAMMRLFGGFGADCFTAYHLEFPLTPGWEDRVPLHQLAPLVVHAIKFGGGYAAATERALQAVDRL